jgi:hypothetical protein
MVQNMTNPNDTDREAVAIRVTLGESDVSLRMSGAAAHQGGVPVGCIVTWAGFPTWLIEVAA